MNYIMTVKFRHVDGSLSQRHPEALYTSKTFMRCFDTRVFRDPDGRGEVNHLGMHPKVLERLIQHHQVGPFLSSTWRKVEEVMRHRHDSVDEMYAVPTFVFYCNKGRHRSVAMATILEHCLNQIGYKVKTIHLMREFWQLETCNECIECRTMTQKKLDILTRCADSVKRR